MTMHLGVRAHDFENLPLETLADEVAAHGFCCVQFAPPKSIPGLDPDAGRVSPGLANHVRKTFAARGIHIAVLGCYINLADPDQARLRHQLERFKRYLRLARDFGCSMVGTETGSLNGDFSFHPDNHGERAFQTVLANVRELVRAAEKSGSVVAIEGLERYVVSSNSRLRRLLDEVDSNNLQVIFDPVNLLSPDNLKHQDEIIGEAFALIGDRIAVLHSKDVLLADGLMKSVPHGQGEFNHELFFRLAKRHKPGIDVLIEDTPPPILRKSAEFVRTLWDRV